jgi:post-segregation antitoxin (ccd killing protein)
MVGVSDSNPSALEIKMARETWIEKKSHWQATGEATSGGRMTGAEITDNNGSTRDRNRDFESQAEFVQYALKQAGMA